MMLFSCGQPLPNPVAARIGAIGMSDGSHKGLKSGGQSTSGVRPELRRFCGAGMVPAAVFQAAFSGGRESSIPASAG
jgi:hypothetical protein